MFIAVVKMSEKIKFSKTITNVKKKKKESFLQCPQQVTIQSLLEF